MKIKIYVSSNIDQAKSAGLFLPLKEHVKKGNFILTTSIDDAHVAITNTDTEVLIGKKRVHIVRFSLYTMHTEQYGVRLICPDDLMQTLLVFRELFMRHDLLHSVETPQT